jgi:uncharacterized protein
MKTWTRGSQWKMGAVVVMCAVGNIASAVPISLTTASGTYHQDFNTLAASGTANTWTNGVTLPGWNASRDTYRAGIGSVNTGALYSFGADDSTDRALGSLASGTTGTIGFGVLFSNNSGLTLDSLAVSYVGEQWRNGGNTSAHSLTFWYRIGMDLTGVSLVADTGWAAFSALDFTSPIAAFTGVALDGNNPANRVALASALSGVTLLAGQQLFLRWKDIDDSGNDHGLAIDDFSFTWRASLPPNGSNNSVPDAGSSLALLGLALGGLGWFGRRFVR